MKQQHDKIRALKQRSAPVTYSTLAIDKAGEVVENRTIRGYLIVWNVVDSYGTYFIRGCCAKSLQERGPDSIAKYKITMLWQHDMRDPIGQFRVLKEDDYGLYFEAVLDEEVPNANRALRQVASGTLNQLSVGFDYVYDKMDYNDGLDAIGLREIDLFEGSIVTLGANSETYAIRSAEQLATALEVLNDDTEDFIRAIPRKQQFELRQLIARHQSLTALKPQQQRQPALEKEDEPTSKGIDYAFLSQNLNLFK